MTVSRKEGSDVDVRSQFHLFDTEVGPHLLVVDGSRVYAIDEEASRQLETLRARAERGELVEIDGVLAELGIGRRRFMESHPVLSEAPVRALSLAVAARCNLGCTYCYAEGGSFGGPAREMQWEIAEASVRRLLATAAPGERVNLAFLGGEPLLNRAVIRRATQLAARLASEGGVRIGFSITTNGTALTEDDGEFFDAYAFAVTVSLDGVGEVHDRLRPTTGGRGTYERIVARVAPLLRRQRRMQISARVTVTPQNLGLRQTLDRFVEIGFHGVGFSPMLSAPSGRDEMTAPDLDTLLAEMIDCGREFERRIVAGERYPFENLENALREIHRGTHRPYPCGAGAGYFGVSASGGLFACHRFVDDPARAMGNVHVGVDRGRQHRWLIERAVDGQEPCRSCWARYLCGGGCHYEVIHRGRPACDYIRGWLDYALGAYVRLSVRCPDVVARLVS